MTWENINLRTYSEIYNILTSDEIEQDEKLVLITQLIFNINVLEKPIMEVKKYFDEVNSLLKTDIPKEVVQDTYIINNTKYKLFKDVEKISTAMFIDYSNYLQNNFNINNYNEFLSIFLIPETHTYNDGYDIRKVQHDIDNYLSIVSAYSIASFFLSYSIRLQKTTLKFLMWKVLKNKTMKWKEKKKIIKQLISVGNYCPYS